MNGTSYPQTPPRVTISQDHRNQRAVSLVPIHSRTRSAIPSRVARKTLIRSSCDPSAVAGSSIGQCSWIEGPGKIGQLSRARSQTVMTLAKCRPSSVDTSLENCREISTPTSRIASIASGCTTPGFRPALNASKRPPPRCRSHPSAIWLRQEFPVHKKRTSGMAFHFGWSAAPRTAAGFRLRLHRIHLYARRGSVHVVSR